jgi:hypothetical protein
LVWRAGGCGPIQSSFIGNLQVLSSGVCW